MKLVLIRLLTFLLTIYIASIIIFKQYYFNVPHIIDMALITVFFILMLLERETTYKINIIIILYALFIVVSLASSLWGVGFNNPSYKALQLFLILMNMFIIYNIVKKYNLVNTFFNGILLGALINYIILLGIIQVPFDIYMGVGAGARAVGTMGNPNILTTAMLISMLVSMVYLFKEQRMSKLFYYYQFINIFLAMYIIVLTVSKKGIILGLLLFLMYLILLLKSKKGIFQIGMLAIFAVIIGQFFIDLSELYSVLEYVERRFEDFSTGISSLSTSATSSTAIRKELIEFGLVAFQSNPLFGYGLDNFRVLTTGQYAHNNPVELLVGVGLIGTILYYGIHVSLLKKIYEMKASELKYLLYFFVVCILLMDLTTVSYGTKLMMFSILYMYIFAESETLDLSFTTTGKLNKDSEET